MTRLDWMWVLVIALALVTMCASPARSGNVGIVQTTGSPTCQQAQNDLMAVGIRLHHLQDEYLAETNESLRLVIKEEARAVGQLGNRIARWRVEHCREA